MTTIRRILHAADIHLDSPLQKLGAYEHAPVERIRGASRRALENMVALAIDQSVDLVLIAGDLYDGDWPDQNTGLFFVAQANRLIKAGIPLVVIRGNHDAANLMTSTLPLPANPDGSPILMRSDQVDLRCFESLGVAVHGRSFRTRAETENLAADYPSPLSGMFNIGLLHTALTGAEGHDPYAPCTPAQLADKGYDYWALGHIHMRSQHGLRGAAPIVFPGNIQGRHIRERGQKGCLILDIDARGGCTTSFHELDVVRWEICRIDASPMKCQDEVIDAFQQWLAGALIDADQRLLVARVEVAGETELSHSLRRGQNQLQAALQAIAVTHGQDRLWLEDLKIHTAMPAESSAVIDLDGPLESLAAAMDELQSDPDVSGLIESELASLLRKLPAELGSDGQSFSLENSAWIADLIESASSEVFGRLQGTERS